MRLVTYDNASNGRAWQGQEEAARVILSRLSSLEQENKKLQQELSEFENMTAEEAGEMLAGM